MRRHHLSEFIRAFHAEINRLESDRMAGHGQLVREHERLKKQLDGLYDAIADGLRTPGLKVKLEGLEAEVQSIEAQIANVPVAAPVLHPNLALLYRRRVEALHESLNADDSRAEAAEVLRSLIERVDIAPGADGPEIVLTGEIANMVELAQNAGQSKTAAPRGAAVPEPYRSSVKVVAGIGFEPMTFRL